jgi:hypothetical protein
MLAGADCAPALSLVENHISQTTLAQTSDFRVGDAELGRIVS